MAEITKELMLPDPVELTEAEIDAVAGGFTTILQGVAAPPYLALVTDVLDSFGSSSSGSGGGKGTW